MWYEQGIARWYWLLPKPVFVLPNYSRNSLLWVALGISFSLSLVRAHIYIYIFLSQLWNVLALLCFVCYSLSVRMIYELVVVHVLVAVYINYKLFWFCLSKLKGKIIMEEREKEMVMKQFWSTVYPSDLFLSVLTVDVKSTFWTNYHLICTCLFFDMYFISFFLFTCEF